MKWRAWARLFVFLVVVGGIGAGIYRLRRVQAAAALPVAPVRQGEFVVIVRCRGELHARNSQQVVAPNVPQLRIVWQAPPGSPVKAGDPVVRFDSSSARQQLQEKDAALKQAQATLEQAQANARIISEQDKRDLSQARYDVERARLEASKQEIVSALQGEQSRIDLGLAEQKMRVQEAATQLHTTSEVSRIASLTRLRDRAQAEIDLYNRRLSQMELKAPSNGIIVYLTNNSQGWMNAKPFKVGDQVWPNAVVAELPDLSTLEMEGKVDEIERGRIAVNNDVRVRVDALPEVTLAARLDSISLLTVQTFEWPPSSSFRGYARIGKPDPRLRPGMNGSMDVLVQRIPNAISVPAKAVFTHQGKALVYVAEKNRYRAAPVRVIARNPDEVALSGIPAGAMVTLTEPGSQEQKK
jgi:HlyD family secretion protein